MRDPMSATLHGCQGTHTRMGNTLSTEPSSLTQLKQEYCRDVSKAPSNSMHKFLNGSRKDHDPRR